MKDDEKVNYEMKTKGLLGRWFWVWAALAAAILGLRLMIGGTDRQPASGDKIKSVTVTPVAPSADSVEELRKKRAEELQHETEVAILAWIRSQGGNHRTNRNSVGCYPCMGREAI